MPRYTNVNPLHCRPNRWEVLRWSLIDRLSGRRKIAAPGPPADGVVPNLDLIHDFAGGPHFTWIGHSSFLLRIGGKNVLLDPVFSRRIGLTYRRHGEPGLSPSQLPPIDVLLISHGHYDHLDVASIEILDRGVRVIAPIGFGRWFRRRRFCDVTELQWWESVAAGSLTISFVPSRHWTQRTPWDFNRSLWGGFVLQADGLAVYFAGDSAYFEGFHEIGERFAPLDIAMLSIGGYEPGWFMERNHMTPEQALAAFADTGAAAMVPMHWGTFQMTDESLREPVERLTAAWPLSPVAGSRRLVTPAIGETVLLEATGREHVPSGGFT